MRRRRKAASRRDVRLEAAFQLEIQRLPRQARPELLAWLRSWRRSVGRSALRARLGRRVGSYRPERIFWEITPTGERRRI